MAPIRRTNLNHSVKASGGLLLAATALLLGLLAVRFGSIPFAKEAPVYAGPPAPDTVTDSLPLDVATLGTEVTPLDPVGMIPREQALEVARREHPGLLEQGNIDAYLVELTNPYLLGGLKYRPVWVIAASGISIEGPVPPLPDGTPADAGTFTRGYIFVDAMTGTWLMARFDE